MATKRTPLNPLTDTPKNKIDITKTFMKGYVKSKGIEDMKWYAKVVQDNTIEKATPKNPDVKVKTYDVAAVREEFVKRYFPQLIKVTSAEEDLNDILSWLK